MTIRRLAPISLLALVGCHGDEPASREEPPPIPVQTMTATPGESAGSFEASGTTRAIREAVISAKLLGTVVEIKRKAGDFVRAGDLLLRIDDREIAGQIGQAEGGLAQARAAASLAETNLRRFEDLFASGAASALELDQARYQHETAAGAVQQAQAAVASARSYAGYADVPAPFDGRVVDKLCEVGDLAAPGRPLMKVEDARQVQAHATLPEGRGRLVAVGQDVAVIVPSLDGRTYAGRVAEVVPAVDLATRTTLVKIDLPEDPDLRSGLYVRAQFATSGAPEIRIPRSALVRRGGMTGVFVSVQARATYRLLEIGDDPGDDVRVLAGLSGGEEIVLDPPATLFEGLALEAKP
jgi:RND family efflux transporter MFP subunit